MIAFLSYNPCIFLERLRLMFACKRPMFVARIYLSLGQYCTTAHLPSTRHLGSSFSTSAS